MRCSVRPLLLSLLSALVLALPGCSMVEGYYKDSKKFYYKHINSPATVDITDRTVLEDDERGDQRDENALGEVLVAFGAENREPYRDHQEDRGGNAPERNVVGDCEDDRKQRTEPYTAAKEKNSVI